MGDSDNGFAVTSGLYAQETAPSPGGVAEMERVIVTGLNIPTAAEMGQIQSTPIARADMEKLGIRNATDLLTGLPQEMGLTANQNS